MKKQIAISVILAMLMLSIFVGVVKAQDTMQSNDVVENIPGDVPFDFMFWLSHSFGLQQFSVVGDARNCGDNHEPNIEQDFAGGSSLRIANSDSNIVIDTCGDENAIVDIFTNDYSHPFMEYNAAKHSPTIISCSNSNSKCIAQVYCCANPEPTEQSDCSSGTTYKVVQCSSWGLGYKCTGLNGVTENKIPYHYSSYAYCNPGSNQQSTCYYFPGTGTQCIARYYVDSCPASYNGMTLYSSKTTCESGHGSCTNPSNWVSSATECCGTKPIGCMDKTCVATSSQCGTCKSQDSDCSQDSECCNYLFSNGLKCLAKPSGSGKWCEYSNSNCVGIDGSCSSDTDCCSGTCGGGFLGFGKTCKAGTTPDPNPTPTGKTITLQEYYSISDDDFMSYANGCKTSSSCQGLEGYTVTCVTDGSFYTQMQKRLFNGYYTACTASTPLAIKIALWLGNFGSLGVLPDSNGLCQQIATGRSSVVNWWSNTFGSGTGICVAKSNSWYGKIWEQVLTTVGGFGLPAQYVMIGAVVLLLAILMIVVSMFKRR